MAKSKPKVHYRAGDTFAGQPLARCGVRVLTGKITTARAAVTCERCKRGVRRDRYRDRKERRRAVGS